MTTSDFVYVGNSARVISYDQHNKDFSFLGANIRFGPALRDFRFSVRLSEEYTGVYSLGMISEVRRRENVDIASYSELRDRYKEFLRINKNS